MTPSTPLTHLGPDGAPRMVDVSAKPESVRTASASGRIRMDASTLDAIVAGTGPKGDVLAVARLAGIQAAKRTADLIPLCHPLVLDAVEVHCEPNPALPGVIVRATVRTTGRTGVEMEALTCVSAALLTVYDMAKALDRGMIIETIALDEKTGGRTGPWRRDTAP
jgi:cyclic pyranopterin monophosphate synthase